MAVQNGAVAHRKLCMRSDRQFRPDESCVGIKERLVVVANLELTKSLSDLLTVKHLMRQIMTPHGV